MDDYGVKLTITTGKWEKYLDSYRFVLECHLPAYKYARVNQKLSDFLGNKSNIRITICESFLMKNNPPSLSFSETQRTLEDLGILQDSNIQIILL